MDLREELLRQIEAAPGEPGPYLVYADWLTQQGDPHGELIALMVEEQSQARLRSSRIEHTYKNLGPILGELGRYFGRVAPSREPVDLGPHFLGDMRKGPLVSTFRYGFFDRIRIGIDPHWWEDSRDVEGMLERIGASVLSRFLRGLTLAAFDSYPGEMWQRIVAGLRHLRPLASLFAGDVNRELVSSLFEAGAIPVHQPRLKQLALRARVIPGAAFALEELAELRLAAERFSPDALAVLTELSALRHLSLELRSEVPAQQMVEALLRGPLLDRLQTLEIVRTPLTAREREQLVERFPPVHFRS